MYRPKAKEKKGEVAALPGVNAGRVPGKVFRTHPLWADSTIGCPALDVFDVLRCIASYSSATPVLCLRATCRKLSVVLQDGDLWADMLQRDFPPKGATGPKGKKKKEKGAGDAPTNPFHEYMRVWGERRAPIRTLMRTIAAAATFRTLRGVDVEAGLRGTDPDTAAVRRAREEISAKMTTRGAPHHALHAAPHAVLAVAVGAVGVLDALVFAPLLAVRPLAALRSARTVLLLCWTIPMVREVGPRAIVSALPYYHIAFVFTQPVWWLQVMTPEYDNDIFMCLVGFVMPFSKPVTMVGYFISRTTRWWSSRLAF